MGTPNDALTPSEASILEDAIESALIDVHVSLPGKIQSYDASTRTADIELQLTRTLPKDDGTYTTEVMPILPNVPVQFPSGGGFSLTFPLAAGDTGLVVFSEQSIDQWRALNSLASPGDMGRHTLTGGVFQPGLMATAIAVAALTDPDNMVFGSQLPAPLGVQVVVKGGLSPSLHLGSAGADQPMLLGIDFLLDYNTHTHSLPEGTSGIPIDLSTAVSDRVFGE